MKKIPCIKCNPKMWKYIKPYLIDWGYSIKVTTDWVTYPILVINESGILGICNNYLVSFAGEYGRELVTDVEEFLKRAAELKGFTYKKEDIMEINGIEIKPGMVINTKENGDYIVFPTNKGMAFVNNTYGGWTSTVPNDIIEIHDLSEGVNIDNGAILWKKPKEIIITMDEIAEKFGYPVESIKIKK